MAKSPNCMLRFGFLLIFSWSFILTYSQNLVSNSSFEDLPMGCPHALGDVCWGYAAQWGCGSEGTPDLYNACAMGGLNVPNTLLGFQGAHTGVGFVGFLGTYIFPNHREYLLTPLTEPLVAGMWYDLTFYLNLPEQSCGIEKIGAYFSTTSPYVDSYDPLPVIPQIETDYGFLDDMVDWMLVTGCYQAMGGEVFLTIGNFQNDANTPLDPNCDSSFTYYLIDDVSLTLGEPPEPIDIDLNGPVSECFSYEIDPDDPGPYFSWSDGSHDPTLEVTSSGLYTVTVTDGCSIGTGSIEVTILDAVPELDIGPTDITICSGDEYTISLDPDWGDIEWNDGSDESEYTISNEGQYTVTVSNFCNSSIAQINVVVAVPPAPIDLGEDVILCVGNEIHLDFDPGLGDFLWEDQSTGSEFTITHGGTYSLTLSNACGEVTDDIVVADLNVPEIDLGEDVQVLCTGEIIDIELDGTLGEYLWQDGSTELDYAITEAGIYGITVTNICGSGSDQINVLYYDAPVFDLGPDIQLCSGDTLMLDGNGIIGTYQWQDHSSGDTFEVTDSGTYALTLTTGCGTANDSVIVSFTASILPPDLGNDFTLCPGESTVLNVSSPGAYYLWQDGSTADSFLITTSGWFAVEVYNACESYFDTVNVIVNANPPQLDLPASLLLCEGTSIVLEANISGVSYLWSDASQYDSLQISSPGSYSLTVSNACGTDRDTVVIIDNGPLPFVSLGNDISLCPGDALSIHPQLANVNSWLWHDGSTDSTFTANINSSISIIASNACGSTHDTLIATLLPATPPLSLGNDTSLCPGESLVLNIATPDVTILWSDGSVNNQLTVDQSGEVYATISNACGQTTDTVLVSALPPIPTLNLGIDQSLCPGEIISLNPGIANVNYLWSDGSVDTFFNATSSGLISLMISNNCGSFTDSITVSESTDGPEVDLGPDILGCEGDIVLLASDIAGVDFLWQDGASTSSIPTTSSGTFILTVSNNCGTDADTVIVDIHGVAPQTNLGLDTTFCEGSSITLVSTSDSETNITWQDGSSLSSYIVNSPGTYFISESNHCGDNTDTIRIDYKNAPVPFELGPDTILCPGEFITLNAPTTADEIIWQDGSSALSLIADNAQAYALTISNDCGSVTDELQLSFDTRIPVVHLDSLQTLCPGDVLELNVTQFFPATYAWSTGANDPVIKIDISGTYSVAVQVPCSIANDETVVVESDTCFAENSFYIPNVFSPNGDQINDLFTINWNKEITVHSVTTTIYDRWGNQVFYSTEIRPEWNGEFKGNAMNPGVFVYQIELKYFDKISERTVFLNGDVTLVR